MRPGNPAVDAPPGQDVVRTMSEIHWAFPQAPSPAEVVVSGPDATGPRVLAAVAALQGRAATAGPIREPVTATAVGSKAEGRAGHRRPAGRRACLTPPHSSRSSRHLRAATSLAKIPPGMSTFG
jgi:hypothetical protein